MEYAQQIQHTGHMHVLECVEMDQRHFRYLL